MCFQKKERKEKFKDLKLPWDLEGDWIYSWLEWLAEEWDYNSENYDITRIQKPGSRR
jgi:hypothetical protein